MEKMLTRRATLFVVFLAVGLVAGCVPVSTGGPPLSNDAYGYPDYAREREYQEEREWEARAHQHYACADIGDRIAYDRQKISEIAPTGRHQKALQWYRDDLQNAERDAEGCRDYRWGERRRQEEEWRARQEDEQARRARDRQRCEQIEQRIRFDRAKIDEIDPTGRHQKAEQWYRDDLQNAQRDLASCRGR
jgi:hypothetical protein